MFVCVLVSDYQKLEVEECVILEGGRHCTTKNTELNLVPIVLIHTKQIIFIRLGFLLGKRDLVLAFFFGWVL